MQCYNAVNRAGIGHLLISNNDFSQSIFEFCEAENGLFSSLLYSLLGNLLGPKSLTNNYVFTGSAVEIRLEEHLHGVHTCSVPS